MTATGQPRPTAVIVGTRGDYALRVTFEGRILDVPMTKARALNLLDGLVKVLRARDVED